MSYITSVDGIIRLFEYEKSRSEDITLLRCMYTIFTCMLRSGIHIHFLSESLARQVSLMAYLPSCNLGCLDKINEQNYRKNGDKIVCNLNI